MNLHAIRTRIRDGVDTALHNAFSRNDFASLFLPVRLPEVFTALSPTTASLTPSASSLPTSEPSAVASECVFLQPRRRRRPCRAVAALFLRLSHVARSVSPFPQPPPQPSSSSRAASSSSAAAPEGSEKKKNIKKNSSAWPDRIRPQFLRERKGASPQTPLPQCGDTHPNPGPPKRVRSPERLPL